jgi:prepilin-type N-terminal cleavage/methylation domain-containing protein
MRPGHSAHKFSPPRSRGLTLIETMVSVAILGIIMLAAVGLMQQMNHVIVKESTATQAGEQVRQALQESELALLHANQITIASSTFIEFICDIDQTPNYNPYAYGTNSSNPQTIQNYLNADRDGDASSIVSAANSWTVGYNLKDDDEDGDGNIDCKRRLYLSKGTLWLDMSVNAGAWGGQYLKKLYVNVSTFTLTYYGSYANIETGLGKNIDFQGNNIINLYDMDHAPPTSRSTYADGVLDDPIELAYITQIHIVLGSNYMSTGNTQYKVESDVYPPLLAVKPYAQ